MPEHWRIVVLALSPLTRFDRNAIIDLENAVARLRGEEAEVDSFRHQSSFSNIAIWWTLISKK